MSHDSSTHSAQIRALEPLVGTWQVTGGAEGTVSYRWLDGGHFLVQEVDLAQQGQQICGIEVIGHLRPFGEPADPVVRSRFYDNQGNTLDYVYRMQSGTLHIWAGEEGSPVAFHGTLAADGRTLSGDWDYAGQGGYASTMTRVDDAESRQEIR